MYEPVFNPSLTVPLNLIPYLTMSNFVYFVSKPPFVHLYLIFHLSTILHLIPNRFPSIYILIFHLSTILHLIPTRFPSIYILIFHLSPILYLIPTRFPSIYILIFHLSPILHLIPNRFPSIYILIFQLPLSYVLSHYAFPFPCESFIFHGFESQSTLPSAVN